MKEFKLTAEQLYILSKNTFYSLIPDCEVNFVDRNTQFFFNLREVAHRQKKSLRLKIIALVIKKCPIHMLNNFRAWLKEYFSTGMQLEIFGLTVDEHGDIKPGEMLEKALNNKRKR